VLDFTSALYLGIRHASRSLRPWDQLTTGVPAALAAPPGTDEIARRLAALIGCERATLAPSTLHLFWDLLGLLSSERVAIYVDAGTYPIARWGVERAAARGVPLRTFPHHDANALQRLLKHDQYRRRSPLVVTDGFCPGCGRHAPLMAYLDSVRNYGGRLIIDDTQALGVYGQPANDSPYGIGGGGSLRWCQMDDDKVIVISSLAKGFGVPIAILAASRTSAEWFIRYSETRVHCSPPSVALIRAAEHALSVNAAHGDLLREQLAHRVRYFSSRLAEQALSAEGGLFPVQTLRLKFARVAVEVHQRLILTTRHRSSEIDRAVESLQRAMSQLPQQLAKGEGTCQH
jgi:8-amino-7-oxononanoate synthase